MWATAALYAMQSVESNTRLTPVEKGRVQRYRVDAFAGPRISSFGPVAAFPAHRLVFFSLTERRGWASANAAGPDVLKTLSFPRLPVRPGLLYNSS